MIKDYCKMRKYNTIFLDRDGTLNPDPGYISSLDQFVFYDFTIPALQRLAYSGNRFCIITNQSGVSRGLIDQDDLNKIHDHIKNEFFKNSIPLLDIYIYASTIQIRHQIDENLVLACF